MAPNPAEREIKLNRQQEALRAATGAWKTEDHPELAAEATGWVHRIRQESVKRSGEIQRHRDAEF
jgi:hypothetical protein